MTTRLRQHGFSLVELMVAMLIGLFLTGGIVYVYVGSKTSYNFNVATANIQENGRFAMHFIVRDVRQAGYRTCVSGIADPNNVLQSVNIDYLTDFGTSLDGFDDIDIGNLQSELYDIHSQTAFVGGADVITMRGATGNAIEIIGTSSDPLHATVGNGLAKGDIVTVTDCTNAAIFQISSADTDPNPHTSGTIEYGTAGSAPGNSTDDLGQDYGDGSQLFKMQTTVYYVAESSVIPGEPSLWRKTTNNAAQELVLGVENMQIKYGVDTDSNRMADQYVSRTAVSDMGDVVSVRIALLMRSLEEVAPEPVPYRFNGSTYANPTDNHIRREFITTVNLRNRSP